MPIGIYNRTKGNKGWFKKGNNSPNKGKKGIHLLEEFLNPTNYEY